MYTILVVEDDREIRTNLTALLEYNDYKVISAENGKEGFKMAIALEPDLILSDIRMSEVDGLELLKKIRQNASTELTPFLFLTAKAGQEEMRYGMSAGADDYIAKPYNADDLLSTISKRLYRHNHYLSAIKEFNDVLMKKVPHELRTPLVAILGLSELIYESYERFDKKEIKEMAGIILNSGNRLHRRIEKFLRYSELLQQEEAVLLNKGSDKFYYEFNPKDEIEYLGKYSGIYGRKKDMNICFEKATLKIEENLMEILLNELLENSLKFSSPGSRVTVTGKVHGEFYIIRFLNNGANIEKVYSEKVKPFNQFNMRLSNKEGLGLGLAMVKKIVELSKGFLSFDVIEKKFSVVTVGITLIPDKAAVKKYDNFVLDKEI